MLLLGLIDTSVVAGASTSAGSSDTCLEATRLTGRFFSGTIVGSGCESLGGCSAGGLGTESDAAAEIDKWERKV